MNKNDSDYNKILERWFSTFELLLLRLALLILLLIKLGYFVITQWRGIGE